MNFDESIFPLTQFLEAHNFSVTGKSLHFIEYTSNALVITVAYANLEHVFYTHVGQSPNSLVELTPVVVKEVFKDNSFQFQATLTIDNLISFLQTSGNSILVGDKKIFENLTEFSERRSKEYTKQILHLQSIKGADLAWKEKDYSAFIKCIDRTEKDQLPQSYLKKYNIAVDKLQR